MKSINAKPLSTIQCILGESPLWHAERNSLLWVDIEAKTLFEYSFSSDSLRTIRQPRRISRIVRTPASNRLIAAMEGGISCIDLDQDESSWLYDIEGSNPTHRCNDGNVDPMGQLWVGTMCMNLTSGAGNLYRISAGGTLEVMLPGTTIPNGLVWTHSKSTMYFIDTAQRCVEAFHYHPGDGNIVHWKTVIHVPSHMGMPDGMAIDTEGKLWIAHYGGSAVYRWDPETGQPLMRIAVPAQQITSCAFGGPNMDILFITSAAQHLSEEALERYPSSGFTFYATTNTIGQQERVCTLFS